MGDKDFKVLKLERNNWVVWKWQFNNCLVAKGYKVRVTIANSNAALALLGSALSEENLMKIINCTNFDQAWTVLEATYENKTTYEPQALYRRLNSFKISSASEVSAGISEIKNIVAQLLNVGETVSNNLQIGSILSALPSSFDIFTMVWKNSAKNDIDDLITKFMAEAAEQTAKQDDEAEALAARKGSKGR